MAKKLIPQEPSELENNLDRLYSAPVPDPMFAARLERQLLTRAAEAQSSAASPSARRPRLVPNFFRRPLLVGAAALLFVVLVSIGLIGPQKVLAEVQRLLGYLPNVGFVQPGQTLFLPAPVEVQQANLILRVESVSVDPDSTRITFTVLGLPQEKFDTPLDRTSTGFLLLPDGSRLALRGSMTAMGAELRGSLEFPPLPAGIDRFTLELPRLPFLPDGLAPENWSVPLVLQAAALTPSTAAAGLLVQPYVPENASAQARGVTLTLLQAAQTAQEIGLQLQYAWQDPAWTQLSGNPGSLADETGRTYPVNPASVDGIFGPEQGKDSPGLALRTLRFTSPSSQPGRFTLTVDQAAFNVRQDVSFSFEAGSAPKVGQIWDLSQVAGLDLIVAGARVKILSASLEHVQMLLGSPTPQDIYSLVFEGQVVPQPGMELQAISLERPDTSGGSSYEALPDNRFRMSIDLPQIPTGALALHIPQATLVVHGPWQIAWTPPSK